MRRLATACAVFAVNVVLASCDAKTKGAAASAAGDTPLRPINALLDAESSAVSDELAATRARASRHADETDAGSATAR